MTRPTNVLFITIDDLRPELGCYGCDHIDSPHLDALAASSTCYTRAYCQVPVCGASRASLFTGVRPTPDRFIDYFARADEDLPHAALLPTHLRSLGWQTLSRGKVLHHRGDSPVAWSQPAWLPADSFPGYREPRNIDVCAAAQQAIQTDGELRPRGPAVECIDQADAVCPDAETADVVIDDLLRLAQGGQPFFLGAGFLSPHLPFSTPRAYWERYDRNTLPPVRAPQRPDDVPPDLLHDSPELRIHYTGIPDDSVLPEPVARELRHGYAAAVSFLDDQIGRILQAVDDAGLRESTIVVFAVDHGWNLGEHGLWCKHSLYETSLRVPLLLRVPGRRPGRCTNLVDNLDLYPTLCELLDVPRPEHELAGISLVPTLDDPEAPTKSHSLSRYHHGESIRDDRFRYNEWRRDGRVVGRTLFDQREDPDETVNLAEDPAAASTMAELAGLLP